MSVDKFGNRYASADGWGSGPGGWDEKPADAPTPANNSSWDWFLSLPDEQARAVRWFWMTERERADAGFPTAFRDYMKSLSPALWAFVLDNRTRIVSLRAFVLYNRTRVVSF